MDEQITITTNYNELYDFVHGPLTTFLATSIDSEACSFETGATVLQVMVNFLNEVKANDDSHYSDI